MLLLWLTLADGGSGGPTAQNREREYFRSRLTRGHHETL